MNGERDTSVRIGEINSDVMFKRTKVVNQDNNIDLILAGRAKKTSIEVAEEPKQRNQRLQKVVIESENDFKHLLGEVSGEKYEICGRPELELITVGYPDEPRLRKVKLKFAERKCEEDGTEGCVSNSTPSGQSDVIILYCSSKTYFLYSPKHEDQLLALLKDFPEHELVIKSARCLFGEHSFNTLDAKKQREWRRFVREFLQRQLMDEERMALMEDRLNFEVLYEDDGVVMSEANSSDEEEEEEIENVPKKRGKRRGGKKKENEVVGAPPATVSAKEVAMVPNTSARVQQRMSVKKGIGLLAKRNSTIK